jgi:thiol:disulfide interchange protein DsbD
MPWTQPDDNHSEPYLYFLLARLVLCDPHRVNTIRFISLPSLVVAAAVSATAAPKTQVHLFLSADSARPGETLLAGIELRMPSPWHTYWRNPGDSGQATQIRWALPQDVTAGQVLWPVPEKLTTPPLITYVYSSNVVLIVPLLVAKDATAGRKEIKATVSWLECADLCLPGSSVVAANLTVGTESKASPARYLIDAWQKRLPRPDARSLASARWESAAKDDARALLIEGAKASAAAAVDFFPYPSELYEVEANSQTLASAPGRFTLRKIVKKLSGSWPSNITGVLVERTPGSNSADSVEVQLSPVGD